MAFFVEEVTNKIDGKGRTSLPAAYRSELEHSEFYGIILFKSLEENCFIGADVEYMKDLFDRVSEQHGPFSREMKLFRREVLSRSKRISVDADGRIVLPKALRDEVGIKDKVIYAGGGDHFEIWSPEGLKASEEGGAADALAVLNGLKPKEKQTTMASLFGGGE